jgi:hypothetical protein
VIPKYAGKVGIIIGTGPSLTEDQVRIISAYRRGDPNPWWRPTFRVFGINNTFQLPVPIDAFFACNPTWWDHYGKDPQLQSRRGITEMWTWDLDTARRHNLNYCPGRWSGGKRNVTSLSTDPEYIHYGHGSGYEVMGIAYHYGVRHFILVGYDLAYRGGYDPANQNPGSGRHYFGEYPANLQHWPGRSGENFNLQNGDMTGLLDCYHTIDCDRLGLRITNCSPGSALNFFETGDLETELRKCIQKSTLQDPPV